MGDNIHPSSFPSIFSSPVGREGGSRLGSCPPGVSAFLGPVGAGAACWGNKWVHPYGLGTLCSGFPSHGSGGSRDINWVHPCTNKKNWEPHGPGRDPPYSNVYQHSDSNTHMQIVEQPVVDSDETDDDSIPELPMIADQAGIGDSISGPV